MTPWTTGDPLVTPEAVALDLDLAGLGSRMMAGLVDSAIQGVIVAAVVFGLGSTDLGSGLGGTWGVVATLLLTFLVWYAYYPFFEMRWNGRSPGKTVMRMRVIKGDGQPIDLPASLIRNLIRIIDLLPSFYGVGALVMLVTRRSQRLGDLAAGTVVVREGPGTVPDTLEIQPSQSVVELSRAIDTAAISDRHYAVVRGFLERREGLDPERRASLAGQIVDGLRGRLALPEGNYTDEELIVALAVSFRQRRNPTPPGTASSHGPWP